MAAAASGAPPKARRAGAASGYSGTPLAAKLGIRAGRRVYVSRAPEDYAALLAPLPPDVRFVRRIDARTDLVHLFDTQDARLAASLARAPAAMRADAVIWVSWPKKSSGLPTEVTEDEVRRVALPLGLVDVKVCAVDATWSALKLVICTERRAAHAASRG
ncbi:MAG: DUF3052 family protein [Proteobacteria bacterium]|nr:DUF3052 family protein [Pseudomonadota bacterium]